MRPVPAVVVVTFSSDPAELDRTLAAIRDAGGADRILVVDTGGRARPTDPDVEVLRSPNDGYGAAANLGLRAARRPGDRAVALLNDDVIVRPGWLDAPGAELIGNVGAVQPKLLRAGTDPPLVNSLGVQVDRYGAGSDVGDGDVDDGSTVAVDIDAFTGGAVLLDVDFLTSTGGFDERWFLYYEDLDLARRGAELGWRYRCAPAAVVEHVGGAATGSMPARTRYLQERNRLWAAARFGSSGTFLRALGLSVRRLRHPPRTVHARALVAGLAGAPRRWSERRAAR